MSAMASKVYERFGLFGPACSGQSKQYHVTYDIKGLKTYLEYTGLIAPLDRLTARADSGTRTNKFPADYTEHSVFFSSQRGN